MTHFFKEYRNVMISLMITHIVLIVVSIIILIPIYGNYIGMGIILIYKLVGYIVNLSVICCVRKPCISPRVLAMMLIPYSGLFLLASIYEVKSNITEITTTVIHRPKLILPDGIIPDVPEVLIQQ